MKKIKVKITSKSPLLLHRFPMEGDDKGKKDKQYIPEEDAAKALYKDEKGCYVPCEMFLATMREAAKNFKNKKSNYKNVILSSVFVEDSRIYLGKDNYDEIDKRPVVVQRQRIVRSRPKFNNWELTTTLAFDDDRIGAEKIKDILVEAGICKGIGDYRPEKGGTFGRFEVKEFEVLK